MTDERFTFEPVYDLHTARVCGFGVAPSRPQDAITERVRGSGWSARQIAEVDAGTAVSAVAHTRRLAGHTGSAAAPIQVPVAADTVVLARGRLRAMLGVGATAPMLEVGPALAAAPAEELVRGLAELRGWGFRIALDGIGRGFGVDLLAAVRPEVVLLERHLAAATPDAGTDAVVRAVCAVAAVSGVRVAATGVEDAGALGALHAHGARLARGPLLGSPRSLPAVVGSTPPELLSLLTTTTPRRAPARAGSPQPGSPHTGSPHTGSPQPGSPQPGSGQAPAPMRPSPVPRADATPVPVRALAADALTLPDDAVADAVRTALGQRPDAGGVVLLDPRRRPTGYLERSRFLLAMAGPFGHALWAAKPAITMADPPRVADERMPLPQAMALSVSGDRSRGYDDLVLLGPAGACTGVVPVSELWRRSLQRRAPAVHDLQDAGPGPRPVPGPRPAPGTLVPAGSETHRHPGDGPRREARTV